MQRNTLPNRSDAGRHGAAPASARNVLFLLVGAGGLVLKGWYSGPADDLIHSYGGNVAASFAVYFWGKLVTVPLGARFVADRAHREHVSSPNLPRVLAAGLALLVVQLFEVFDGFGLMANVYDRLDLAANTVGVAIAFALDVAVQGLSEKCSSSPAAP
ncbi:MAG: hypothetical protein ACM3NQ_00765 [Bacteroidales bacterium]